MKRRKTWTSDRILLVLDLDETLVYASEKPLERTADFRIYPYHVYRRPYLDEFLDICAQHFELAVWSSASDKYVDYMVDHIFPDRKQLQFVWGESRATYRRLHWDDMNFADATADHMHYVKTLAKIRRYGWSLDRTLIVDDTPQKSARNYGNAIYPKPYEGDIEDRELELLAKYLVKLKDADNVRNIEKRRWRESVLNE